MAKLMNGKNIFDGRNLYDLDTIKKAGFYYESIGRMKIEESEKV